MIWILKKNMKKFRFSYSPTEGGGDMIIELTLVSIKDIIIFLFI